MSNVTTMPQPPQHRGVMTSAIETREAQQAQISMMAAKRFPRDEKDAIDRILNSCCRESLATQAQYQFARGGTDICGPSIRLAEAIAQHWGNIESGWRELDRHKDTTGTGVSVIEAFAWDLQSNYRVPRVFNVRHWRDTRSGGYALTDERDIYELCANQASRRVRACLLAVIPGDVVEDAQRQCDATLAAKADTSPEAQKKIIAAFEPYSVNKDQIEKLIQRRIDSITPAQVIRLRKILASLKDGMSSPEDWFEGGTPKGEGKQIQETNPFDKEAFKEPEAKTVDVPTTEAVAAETKEEPEPTENAVADPDRPDKKTMVDDIRDAAKERNIATVEATKRYRAYGVIKVGQQFQALTDDELFEVWKVRGIALDKQAESATAGGDQ